MTKDIDDVIQGVMSSGEMVHCESSGVTDLEVDAIFRLHTSGGPQNVVLAIVTCDGRERYGIFSTLDRAHEWADTFDCDDEESSGAVFVPYVIDVPEYGNVPKGQRQ